MDVYAADSCSWSATSPQSWISVTGSGAGTGALMYTVAANTSALSRSGQIVVGNQTVNINQAGTGQPFCNVPNGNDDVPDDGDLQCLLNNGGVITLDADVNPGYFIATGLKLSNSDSAHGLKLTSTSTALPGLNWAPFWATSDLKAPILEVDSTASYYTIENIWFYGNRLNRVCVQKDTVPPERKTTENTNLVLRGHDFTVQNVEVDMAVCASGASVVGANYHILNSWFANNGFPDGTIGQGTEPWADGLTVLNCDSGEIRGNHFVDNTDIDLITANSIDCNVQDNHIDHYFTYGFAGLMVSLFEEGGGKHGGTTYSGNIISSAVNQLSFGIMIGFHPWKVEWNMDDVGTVRDNIVSGAVVNLQIEADSSGQAVGEVTVNTLFGAQGNKGYKSGGCSISTNYAVYHSGGILHDVGSSNLQFDSTTGCILY